MLRCIQCNAAVYRIVQPENEVVEKCGTCGRRCDRYYEFSNCQKWISITLLEKPAWIHVLFNKKDIRATLFCTALLSRLIEAYVVRTSLVYGALRMLRSKGPVSNVSSVATLQLFRNVNPKIEPLMAYQDTLPNIFICACGEYLLCLLVTVIFALHSWRRGGSALWDVVLTWMTCVNLAYSAKLCFVVFLIWRIPIALVSLVDLISLLWAARGFSLVENRYPPLFTSVVVLICTAATRYLFRSVTQWSPQLLV
ncbi:Arv1-like family, putative [Trypanosoma equiperdum]|uniref:Protein ARV n=4 Tax=Trypanozoon TaxID=39700 RepID=Q582W1_TRYB2|nr:hypothetical protein, conserved [Trypanosoma brucei gambiense DAL972]XP_843842.1 hypothetical protein, conserved [Trypanosoma brucei brucei TREU927]AAX80728.1 hypothetical protein, conserved [Trypanosoma brucei]RHW73554.1 Arv1-like family [Trypanosoma brucei equiperdum]SCU70623.1 Arv1-like family, putative [Trypanosoma equiperdum]AAZ10283.1 hypothetical protein, conserved [Trypanosoma brucei brucei TREU927]CBH09911.1 hypothetical protein, conserved [Trypanosoma brucei gambiense DAL972]|eukprot:XP_011772204.1 hypothetical protein, conserved [Trypanosoma brucei gambiense DAL972]